MCARGPKSAFEPFFPYLVPNATHTHARPHTQFFLPPVCASLGKWRARVATLQRSRAPSRRRPCSSTRRVTVRRRTARRTRPRDRSHAPHPRLVGAERKAKMRTAQADAKKEIDEYRTLRDAKLRSVQPEVRDAARTTHTPRRRLTTRARVAGTGARTKSSAHHAGNGHAHRGARVSAMRAHPFPPSATPLTPFLAVRLCVQERVRAKQGARAADAHAGRDEHREPLRQPMSGETETVWRAVWSGGARQSGSGPLSLRTGPGAGCGEGAGSLNAAS